MTNEDESQQIKTGNHAEYNTPIVAWKFKWNVFIRNRQTLRYVSILWIFCELYFKI